MYNLALFIFICEYDNLALNMNIFIYIHRYSGSQNDRLFNIGVIYYFWVKSRCSTLNVFGSSRLVSYSNSRLLKLTGKWIIKHKIKYPKCYNPTSRLPHQTKWMF